MKRDRHWSDEEERRLVDMRSAGSSIKLAAQVLKRSTASVQLRLTGLRRRDRETAGAPYDLKFMSTFNPLELALPHDRLTDEMETWSEEDARDFRENAIFNPDGTVEWRQFVFDGSTNVREG